MNDTTADRVCLQCSSRIAAGDGYALLWFPQRQQYDLCSRTCLDAFVRGAES